MSRPTHKKRHIRSVGSHDLLHPDSYSSHAVPGRWRAFPGTRPKTTVVASGARLSSLLWENRGFAALPRDRCASSFSQSLGRKHFYTGSNPNWCGLNILSKLARWYANRTLARSTACSTVERSSDFVHPPVAGSTSTPRDSVQASGSAPAARPPLLTVLLSDRSITKSRVLLSVSSFGPTARAYYGLG